MLRDRSGRVVGPDGQLIAGDAVPSAAPDSAPAKPAADKPKIRVGNDVDGYYDATEAEVQTWRAEHAAAESRRLTLPASAEAYEVRLSPDFKPPEAFKDYKPQADHPLMGQAEAVRRRGRFNAATIRALIKFALPQKKSELRKCFRLRVTRRSRNSAPTASIA